MAKRRLLVTGGAGFQGWHLAQRWASAGHDVAVLNTPSERARQMVSMLPSSVLVIWGSVTDPEIMNKTAAWATDVVHLAAWTSVDQSFNHPRAVYRVNSEAMYTVLEAIRQNCPEARVLIASSCEVYGYTRTPAEETAPLNPHSPYAAGKAAGDRLAYSYLTTYGLNLAILRPCNIFGPWQKSGSAGAVIPTFLEAAISGRTLRVTGDGSQRREFLYIEDLVLAYDALLNATCTGTFNVGSGYVRSIATLAEQIARHFGVPIAYVPEAARPGEVSNFQVNDALFRETTGWAPEPFSFEDRLKTLMDWWASR
jgi:nucleoside-diphosphate-sugar epimerase